MRILRDYYARASMLGIVYGYHRVNEDDEVTVHPIHDEAESLYEEEYQDVQRRYEFMMKWMNDHEQPPAQQLGVLRDENMMIVQMYERALNQAGGDIAERNRIVRYKVRQRLKQTMEYVVNNRPPRDDFELLLFSAVTPPMDFDITLDEYKDQVEAANMWGIDYYQKVSLDVSG